MFSVTMEYGIYVSNNWVITISVTLIDAGVFSTWHYGMKFQWIFNLKREHISSRIASKKVVCKAFVIFR